MKKIPAVTLFMFVFCLSLFCQTSVPPQLLKGIWQGSDRLVLFSQKDEECAFVLRTFYGWYDDRASEPQGFSEIKGRSVNDTTSSSPQDIGVLYRTVIENSDRSAGIYEVMLKYQGVKEYVSVPVAVIEDRLYTDFYLCDRNDGEVYLKELSCADGIKISTPVYKKELKSYQRLSDDTYAEVRYWLTSMDYTDDKASFTLDEARYIKDKYIKTGDRVYTCSTGKSTRIRHVSKVKINEENLIFDKDRIICTLSQPYLVKAPQKTDEELLSLVEQNNQRRKDPPKPLFPVKEINFHWKEISELEKYNPVTWNRRNIDLGK